ncbi:MAG: iron-containing redox enzyme family protein [Patescibacteria group bacterium]
MQCKPLRVYMENSGLVSDPFLNRALDYIEEHELFKHRFFQAFTTGGLSIEQVKIWAKQRLFSSNLFTCFLGAFVSNIEDRGVRRAYAKQLWEEEGMLDPDKMHSRYLNWLIFALGVSRQELDAEVMLPGTRHFVATYMRISREGDVVKGMGMYALGSDPVIAMEMTLLLKGLNTIRWLRPEDKAYCSEHVEVDVRHAAELNAVLLPFLTTETEQKRAWQGMTEILEARKGFYDGIANAIGI